jgi:Bacterial PH domain
VFVAAWIGFLCLLMVLGSIGEHSAQGLFLVFVWLPWLVPVTLAARSRVTIAGDTLTYRGALRTRTWRRGEVRNFEVASRRWLPRVRLITMHTANGERVSFEITARSWPQNTAQVDRWYAALENWRLGNNQPAPD